MKRFSWLLALFFGVSLVYAQNEKEVIHGISYRVKMSLTKNMQKSEQNLRSARPDYQKHAKV